MPYGDGTGPNGGGPGTGRGLGGAGYGTGRGMGRGMGRGLGRSGFRRAGDSSGRAANIIPQAAGNTPVAAGEKMSVNQDACIGCGLCVTRCPQQAISMQDGKAHINQQLCDGCGVCVSVCPVNAIS